jgi:hypothetical protein
MSQQWESYFSLEGGAMFTVGGGLSASSRGEVLARTDSILRLRVNVPKTLLHAESELVLEIEHRNEGSGNRLCVTRTGSSAIHDASAIVLSSEDSKRRAISSSIPIDGSRLLIEVENVDADTAKLTLNAHLFELRRDVSRHGTVERAALRAQKVEPHGKGLTIEDWSRLVSFSPAVYLRPQSVAQLESMITAVASGSMGITRVRTPGSLHSCSEIDVSDGILDVSHLPKTIEWSEDNSTVTVSANWTLHEFLLELSHRGKSLQATGGTDAQTLAGLISTNTAPATPRVGIYDNLQWVEYVCTDPVTKGAITRRLTAGEPSFAAAVCSLGAIGVLTKVRFKVVDELFFRAIQKVVSLDEVLNDVEATSRKYDFWRIDWIPEMDRGLMWAAQQIPRKDADPNGTYPTDYAENTLNFLYKFTSTVLGQSGPLLTSTIAWIYKIMALFYQELDVTGPLRNMLPVDRRAPLLVAMAEWGFHPNDLAPVRAICRSYYEKNGWPNIPIEIELTKTDSYMMSAWNWPDLNYIVKFNFMYLTETCKTATEKQMIYKHLQGLWDELTRAEIRFKAHWGKINFMDAEFVQKNYDLSTFRPFVQGIFLNDYLAQRIGGV